MSYPFQGGPGSHPYPPSMSYPTAPSAPTQNPYPGYNPYPIPGQTPYPNPGQAPYPTTGQAPYPSSQAPYPSPGQAPYPSSQAPYPSPGQAPYPSSQAPYPSPGQAPYPTGQTSYSTNQAPYPTSQPSYPSQPYPLNPSQAGYPPSQPAYPPLYPPVQSSYPTSTPSYPGAQPSYPGATPGSHSGYPQHSHPGSIAHIKSSPTVRPANPFNPRGDAEVLRKAMKGLGTDEAAIIAVLSKRTNAQRQEIAREFKTLYGKDLLKDLKSETGGKFEQILVALMTPTHELYAAEVRHAISGIGTNESTLIEVLCTLTNAELHYIKQAYEKMYGSSMESDLASDTSGNFKRLLISLCMGRRDESTMADLHSAESDAQALLRAGELRFGTDESTFNAILCSRSYAQLQAIFSQYERLTGHPFEKAIKQEFSGDIEEGLLAIVKSVKNKAAYLAECLKNSMAGAGTNDRALIRLMVTRCEVDLEDIKNQFQALYGKSLESFIKGDTSGDYKKMLIALLG